MKRVVTGFFALAALAISAYVLTEARRPIKHASDPTAPLTDVPARAPAPDVRADERPHERLARMQSAAAAAPKARFVAPSLMRDYAHPPRWTRPRAIAG